MSVDKQSKILLFLLLVGVSTMIVKSIGHLFAFTVGDTFLSFIIITIPIVLLLLHSYWVLGTYRAVFFLLLAAIAGLVAEVYGLYSGTFFGGRYVYNGDQFRLWDVPYVVPLFWAVFIYTAYSITNSFVTWLKITASSGRLAAWSLLPLIISDGCITVLLDLILDPVKVHEGAWTWLDKGWYFGIPWGNFVGWFFVTIVVTGAYRFFEYHRPANRSWSSQLALMPVVGYGFLGLGLSLSAVTYGMYTLALLSVVLVVGLAALNLFLFVRWRGSVASDTQVASLSLQSRI